MVFGEVFEFGLWPNAVHSDGAQATVGLDSNVLFGKFPSLSMELSGDGYAGVANRGLGNEGLVFRSGRDYEGYLFTKADSAAKLLVRLEDYVNNIVRFGLCAVIVSDVCIQ